MVSFNQQNTAGFTLIEMIVSLGVFSVVVTTAVGAMLILIATNQRLQAEQSVMTNLAFAMDTMTREMRTGYNYYCVSHANTNGTGAVFGSTGTAHEDLSSNTPFNDCTSIPTGHKLSGVSFVEGGDSITSKVSGATRILYFYDEFTDPDNKTIKRKVGNAEPQSIVSSGLYIEKAEFTVTGSSDLSLGGDVEQPTITVYIEAREKNDPTAKIYYLETTVTQRALDL